MEHLKEGCLGCPLAPKPLGLAVCRLPSRHWALGFVPRQLLAAGCDHWGSEAEVTCPGPHGDLVVEPGFEPTSANPKASVAVAERSMWHSLGSHLAYGGLFLMSLYNKQ